MSRSRHRVHVGYRGHREEPLVEQVAACPHPEKQTYRTKRRAKRSLRRMTGVEGRETLHVYRCVCGLHHIGHKPGSRKNRLRLVA